MKVAAIVLVLFWAVPVDGAQLLVISKKLEKTNVQAEGDIVGVFPDTWKFSPTEQDVFTIIQVPGFTKEELQAELESRQAVIEKQTYGALGAEWRDKQGVLRQLQDEPKHRQSIKNLKQADITKLGSVTITKEAKRVILDGVLDNLAADPRNQVAVEANP